MTGFELTGRLGLADAVSKMNISVSQATERLYEAAQANVPYYDGTLEATGRWSADETEGVVSYDHPEAATIHEAVDADIGQGEAKWLERAMDEARSELLGAIAAEIDL